jgi:riboflavin kinase / FMN adenylyltransferase
MKIKGTVINGKNKGEGMGFPTINLEINDENRDDLESGVYAGKVFFNDVEKKVAIFIDLEKKILEAYILNFSGNLREKTVEVEIGEKIREVIKFENDEDLIKQIEKDVEKIKNME